MKISPIGAISLILFGCLTAGVAYFIDHEKGIFAEYGKPATASFVTNPEDSSSVLRKDTNVGKGTRWSYLISYTYNEELHETYLHRMAEGPSVHVPQPGENIDIYIDTRHPDEVWDKEYVAERDMRFIITCTMSVLFIFGGIALLVRGRKEDELY